jgi:hypothetical protein
MPCLKKLASQALFPSDGADTNGRLALVKRYTVEIGSPTTDEDMQMTDHFALIPKGGRCILKLSRV